MHLSAHLFYPRHSHQSLLPRRWKHISYHASRCVLVRFSLIFLFVPCGGLIWLHVSFSLHVKYTISYRIVFQNPSYHTVCWYCPDCFVDYWLIGLFSVRCLVNTFVYLHHPVMKVVVFGACVMMLSCLLPLSQYGTTATAAAVTTFTINRQWYWNHVIKLVMTMVLLNLPLDITLQWGVGRGWVCHILRSVPHPCV